MALFETAGDGLNQLQFFAMLRLIAHAQNGRKISKALVYLGGKMNYAVDEKTELNIYDLAPLPQFHANAIDALIKSDIASLDSKESSEKSPWWQNYQQQITSNNRRSYGGPFASYNATPKAQTRPDTTLNCFYTPSADDVWKATPSAPPLFHEPSTSTHKSDHSHSRSKSAGNAASYLQPADTQGQLHSSRSSLSLHELNNASGSLLLTQKFVYQSPSLKKQELPSKNNPFYPIISNICSPFGDENYSGTIEAAVESNYIPIHDDKPNVKSTRPPPVPNQATKSLFPKYAKNTRETFTGQDLLI